MSDCLHVKIKRKNQTFFILINDPDAPGSELMAKLSALLDSKPVKDFRLLYEGRGL